MCTHSQEANERYAPYTEMRGKIIFNPGEGSPQDDG